MAQPVYEPAEDSLLICKHIKRYTGGRVLDIGTGSGILAIEAARHANKVVAVDINPAALSHARREAKRAGTNNIRFLRSDLFSRVPGRFDIIVCNPPYLPQDRGIEDTAVYGGRRGYEYIERILEEVNDHLAPGGKLLLLFSSLTGKKMVDGIIARNLFQAQLIDEQPLFFERLYVYLIQRSALLEKLKGITRLLPLAHGHRGWVFCGVWRRKKVAVKIKNPDSKAFARIGHEATMLGHVNRIGVGPRLLRAEEEYLIMELIEGTMLPAFIEQHQKKNILPVIKRVLQQLFALDMRGIEKEEMHHPVKHVIVKKGGIPVLVDFERARFTQKPHNVTQFCQYLCSAHLREVLASKGIKIDGARVMTATKAYRKELGKTSFLNILGRILKS